MLPMKKGQAWLPSIFNDFLGNEWVSKSNEAAPSINIMECEKRYRVEIATPGMTKEDFTLEIRNDNHLVITMEKKCECDTPNDPNCECETKQDTPKEVPKEAPKETPKETPKESLKEALKEVLKAEKTMREPHCGCSYEQEEKAENRHGKYLRREFSFSQFRQTLVLPDNVDKAKISAKQENGILKIFLPKKDEYIEANAVKKINIE